ncbi:hypothetical protein ACSBR2_041525 [Camellia fascicularis]
MISRYIHLLGNLPIITHTTNFLQNLQHFFHRWPHIALILQTPKYQLSNHCDHLPHLIIRFKPKALVNKLMKFMILSLINSHIRQINFMAMPCNVHSWLRQYKLDQNNPKAINITFISKLVTFMVLRVHITRRTLWGRGHMGDVSWEKMRNSKISNFNAKVAVEMVNDVRSMKVSQLASGFKCNAHSCNPREGIGFCAVAVEVIGDSAIGDIFIDEEEPVAVAGGELLDGLLVAVKLLNETKDSNGEEFINEVTSISRTSHVNIVSLVGYCFEGHKRALIYEYMPNGSLEKFIHNNKSHETNDHLEWKIMHKIAVGVARGLEYLHHGYSHTADVYSYEMLVLEKVQGRENIGQSVEDTSDLYFPHSIYKKLECDGDIGLHGIESGKDEKVAPNMILVGLCCI